MTPRDPQRSMLQIALRDRARLRLSQVRAPGAVWEIEISHREGRVTFWRAKVRLEVPGVGADLFEALANDPFAALDGAFDSLELWSRDASRPAGELPA